VKQSLKWLCFFYAPIINYIKSNFMQKTLFFHGKTSDCSRFTIAGEWDRDLNYFIMGISVCSPKDSFIKRLGRAKAKGRMLSTSPVGNFFIENVFRKSSTSELEVVKEFIKICSSFQNLSSRDLRRVFNIYK
jgi:hypothetical protein